MSEPLQQQKVSLAAKFIETQASAFHPAFAAPTRLNRATMKYEDSDILDLKETLDFHQKATPYVDFIDHWTNCNWDVVHEQLALAQAEAVKIEQRNEKRAQNPAMRVVRAAGATATILAPGLSVFPSELFILHGALAVVFSVGSPALSTAGAPA